MAVHSSGEIVEQPRETTQAIQTIQGAPQQSATPVSTAVSTTVTPITPHITATQAKSARRMNHSEIYNISQSPTVLSKPVSPPHAIENPQDTHTDSGEAGMQKVQSPVFRPSPVHSDQATSFSPFRHTVLQRTGLTQSIPQSGNSSSHQSLGNQPSPAVRYGISAAMRAFLKDFYQRIQENQQYPPIARQMGLEGTTTVKVTLLPDGAASSLEIAMPSGHEMLDEAAIRTIQHILPVVPPLPPHQTALAIEVPIQFTLR